MGLTVYSGLSRLFAVSSVIIVITAIGSFSGGVYIGGAPAPYPATMTSPGVEGSRWQDDLVIIGDAFRIEFFSALISILKGEYGFELLHNSVQAWIDYRDWMRYPAEWNNIGRLINESKRYGVPIGVVYGYHVGDSVTAPYSDEVGFLHYYRALIPENEKWRYPNGTIARDPYSVGTSRTFSGYLATRVLGDPMEIMMLKRLDIVPTMMPQNPYWRDFFVDWGKKVIDLGADTFFLDSPDLIFTFFWGGGWGCNDTWEGVGLIDYLKRRFSAKELREFGVDDIDSFCLRDYLVRKYGAPRIYSSPQVFRERFVTSWPVEFAVFPDQDRVLRDPVFREALIYWYKAAIEFVREISASLKAYAREKGREVILTSNNYFAWVPHITLAPYMDALYIETNQVRPPPYQTAPALCKLAISSSNSSKPVWIGEWVLNFANPFDPDSPPKDVTNLIRLRVAEAYASGCLMLIPFGTGHPEEGWPPKRLVAGVERGGVSPYYRFIRENREIFQGTVGVAGAAIVASLPTAIWGFIPSLGVYRSPPYPGGEYEVEIMGWARVLESLHIPYDVLLLGMEGILGTDSLDRLGRYSLLIAPHLTHVSEGDLEAIARYLDNGGRLIVTQDFGLYDEMSNRRDAGRVKAILNHRNVVVVGDWLGREYSRSLNGSVLKVVEPVVRRNMQSFLSTNASPTLYISLLAQPRGGRILIHLVNYDYGYNATSDYIRSHPPLWISLNLPEAYRVSDIRIISPDTQQAIKPSYRVKNNQLNITVPGVKVWSIIVVEPEVRTAIETVTSISTRTQTTTITTPTPIPIIVTEVRTATRYNTVERTYTHTRNLTETLVTQVQVNNTVIWNNTIERTYISPAPYPVEKTLYTVIEKPTPISIPDDIKNMLIFIAVMSILSVILSLAALVSRRTRSQ